eukprot:7380647-Prymnesium_polylepis.3
MASASGNARLHAALIGRSSTTTGPRTTHAFSSADVGWRRSFCSNPSRSSQYRAAAAGSAAALASALQRLGTGRPRCRSPYLTLPSKQRTPRARSDCAHQGGATSRPWWDCAWLSVRLRQHYLDPAPLRGCGAPNAQKNSQICARSQARALARLPRSRRQASASDQSSLLAFAARVLGRWPPAELCDPPHLRAVSKSRGAGGGVYPPAPRPIGMGRCHRCHRYMSEGAGSSRCLS